VNAKIKIMGAPNIKFKDFFFRRVVNKKNFTYRLLIKVLEPYLGEKSIVLDAGCGEGNLSIYMARRGARVLGIDISKRAIKICKRKSIELGLNQKLEFLNVDIIDNQIDGTFHLATCFEVLEHISNYGLAIKRLSELLKPSGILIVSTPSANAPLFKLGLTKREDTRSGHLRRYTLEELVDLLKKEGLEILETKKTEGIFRNFLFYNRLGALPLKFANRFTIVSDIFTFIDNITLKLFGESQIIVVAQKPKKKK